MELAVHTTDATGQAKTSGTNQLVWQDTSGSGIIGSSFDPAWVGRKIYFNESVYLVSAFVNSKTLTLTTLTGGDPGFSTVSPVTEIFTVCYISGSGYCNVAPSGANSVVTWVSGDPFLVYATALNFQFYVNGTLQPVVTNNGIASYTVSGTSLGTLTNATYNYYYDVNDQISTFRLHRSNQDIENLSIYTRYDGNYIEAQGGNVIGSYRNIYLTSGVIGGTTLANTKARQIVIGKNGNLSLGGDGTQAAITLTNPANPLTSWANFAAGTGTYTPSLQIRGSNATANLNIDLKGTSSSGPYFEITCNNYGTSIQRLYPQSGSYINSDLTIYNKFYIKGPAGNYRGIEWATSASDYSGPIDRFEFVIDNSSESGSNAGSNLQLNAFSDTGSFLNTVFFVSRQTQVVNFTKAPIMPTPYYATLAALVSALPPASYPYQTALIGDASSPTIGSMETGGGSVKCRVFSDGTNYRIG
jgi:hypothetical protein